MNFDFNYIYYRITKAYFKWDGRTGITGIVGITMIQVLLLMDMNAIFNVLFLSRNQTNDFVNFGKWVYLVLYFVLLGINYKKYSGQYNSFRAKWKEESKRQKVRKDVMVVLSLLVPWIPLILIGIFWDK